MKSSVRPAVPVVIPCYFQRKACLLRKRHERRGWLLTLVFAAIVVGLAGFLEPSIHEELVAVLKDRERPSRLALGIVCSHFTLKRVVELSPATCLPVRPEP